MRVALISTYPPAECGIGNYSHELVRALERVAPDVEVQVVAERVTGAHDPANVQRAWRRTESWLDAIEAAVVPLAPDVVHIQHEESIFGQDERLLELLRRLRQRGIHSVVTLHTVHDTRRGRRFHQPLSIACDRIVAHQRAGMASVLEAQGVAPARIELIGHGTPTLTLPDRATARAMLDLPPDVPLALFFGFIHYRKRVHVALEGFRRAASRLGDARLVVAGRMRRSHPLDTLYARWLEDKLRRGEASGQVIYRPGFVPDELKPAYYAAADLVVLPHDQPYGSASGVLHEALAAGRPIIATRGKKFAEAIEALADQLPQAFARPGDVRSWEQGFEFFLRSVENQHRASSLVTTLANETSWSSSAARHAVMYRTVAATAA